MFVFVNKLLTFLPFVKLKIKVTVASPWSIVEDIHYLV